MGALLGLFSGPYALLARIACYLALAVGLMGFGAYQMHKWDSGRYDALAHDYATFKATTAALGKAAQAAADKQKAADLAAKEKADAQHKKDVDTLAADNERLRRTLGARGSFVSPAAAGARRPDLICYDRALFSDAVDDFAGEVSGQVKIGGAAAVDLNTAKAWAQRPIK